MGNRRAAGHWIVAIVFSSAATVLMRWLPATVPPAIFFDTAYAEPLYLTGGQDLILCATVYGLAGMIVGARQPESLRPYYYSGTVAGIIAIALARLYLGLEWASASVIALVIAFVWLNLLMIGYRRQRPRPVQGSPIAAVLAAFVGLAALLAVLGDYPIARLEAEDAAPPTALAWQTGGYRRLPMRITTLYTPSAAPLNVQVAGTRADLARMLTRAGWRQPPALNIASVLHGLVPDAPIDTLPVMPRIHAGHAATRVWIHPVDATQRWVLRLWPTAYVTQRRRLPIWVVSVGAQRLGQALHIVAVARDDGRYQAAVRFLARNLAAADIGLLPPAGDRPLLLWPNKPRSMLK
jgi:undecaprenyl-diphosphatase